MERINELYYKHATYYLQRLQEANKSYNQGHAPALEALTIFEEDWGQIEAGYLWSVAHSKHTHHAIQLCDLYPGVGFDLLSLRLTPRECAKWLEKGLEASRLLGKKVHETIHLLRLGSIYAEISQYQKGLDCLIEGLAIAEELNDTELIGTLLSAIGSIYYRLGDLKRAKEFSEKSLSILHNKTTTSMYSRLGLTYDELGDKKQALHYLEHALLISKEKGNKEGEGLSLNNLGVYYYNKRKYKKALDYFEQALIISIKLGYEQLQGNSLGNIGMVIGAMGRPNEALAYHQDALKLSRKLENKDHEASDLNNIASQYIKLGELELARQHLQEARAIYEELNLTDQIKIVDRNIAVMAHPGYWLRSKIIKQFNRKGS